MDTKKEFMLLYISIGSFLLMSFSFLLMPIDFATKGLQIVNILIGIMFWLFLLIGIITQVALTQKRKKWFKKHHLKQYRLKMRVGVISFFQNTLGCIADIISAVSLIALIITAVLTDAAGFMCYVFLELFVFSFIMHCILNGKNYYFITNKQKFEKMQRKSVEGLK